MKKLVILLLVNLLAQGLFAEVKSALSTADKFTRASQTYNGTTLPFRLFTPEGIDTHKKYPLVLALHGLGECGADNNLQLTANRMATCWAEPDAQLVNPCYVIAPQLPYGSGWDNLPISDVLLNLVDSALHRYNIDKDRVYITGLSLGGFGVWNCLVLRPDLFAAAVPIAGWGNNAKGAVLKNIPIWDYHGQSDNVINVDNSRYMIESIVNQGVEAIYPRSYWMDNRGISITKLNNELKAHPTLLYSELYGYTHDVWGVAYFEKAMFTWLFSKRKVIINALTLSNPAKDTLVSGTVPLKWNTAFEKDSVEIWFKSERQDAWKLLKKVVAKNKYFLWNTDQENECIYGKLRLCLLDSNSLVYAQCESHQITIDHVGNCKPYVRLKTPEFYKATSIISKVINIKYIANDIESDSLRVVFKYSTDYGKTFYTIDSAMVAANNTIKIKQVWFSKLIKSNLTIVKLQVYDRQRLMDEDRSMNLINLLGIDPLAVLQPSLNSDFTLLKPYPNPAGESVHVSCQLPVAGQIIVTLYNILGKTSFQRTETVESGLHTMELPTSQLPNGVYSCMIKFSPKNKTYSNQKVVILMVQH